MTREITVDKLHRYLAMKTDHARKRMNFLRKPIVIASRPHEWVRRRRPHVAERLDESQRRTSREMDRAGFASADDVVDRSLRDEIQKLVNSRMNNGGTDGQVSYLSKRKNFWQPILSDDDLCTSNPLVRYALTPRVIDVVTSYLGEVPYLASIELVVSRPVADQAWRVSQLWHRDYNDRRMVKLFTYFSDVKSEADGPFTFIPADALDGGGPMFPVHKTDAAMAKFADLTARKQIFGARGTSFYIDTRRCFHCGSRITDDSYRIAYIATFTTFAPYYRYDNKIAIDRPVTGNEQLLLRV